MVRACASVQKISKFLVQIKNFDILSLRLWCLNLSCLSRLEILDIWQPVPLQRKIEFVQNLIRPRFLSICNPPSSLQYPTKTTTPNPNTLQTWPNLGQFIGGDKLVIHVFDISRFLSARWEMNVQLEWSVTNVTVTSVTSWSGFEGNKN